MKRALLAVAVVSLAVAAYPAYADDYAASVQNVIDVWTDVRNDYLAESFFGKSYPTPRIAAVETVNSAIEMYESTRAEPQTQVRDRGTFVQHPANPYGTSVVAFDVINSMYSTDEIYPFVIDVATLNIIAEGAFPGTVGLSAVFLNDADFPIDQILDRLEISDGMWISYVANNPATGQYTTKNTWLSLYDGYIFGSGYYVNPDENSIENVESMVARYNADGTDSFASLRVSAGLSFVLDADTLAIISHTESIQSENEIRDALDVNWPIDSLQNLLRKHGSLWVSYPDDDRFVRAYLEVHDGHIFGSGQKISSESRLQSLVNEMIYLYDIEGTDIFDHVTSMERTNQIVVDPNETIVLAFAGIPAVVGFQIGTFGIDQSPSELKSTLALVPGLWVDAALDPLSPVEVRSSIWLVLHDGYYFASSVPYVPSDVAVQKADEAVALYEKYGTEAFDRITWQSVRPEIIYPFVADTETWELKAHAALPERVGVCCSSPIAASNNLTAATAALKENPGIWLEYDFYNPISQQYEYKRAWLTSHDGYTFGAGYYFGNTAKTQGIIDETIAMYNTDGADATFAAINDMFTRGVDYPFVLDADTLVIVAHGQNPNLVGTNFEDKVQGAYLPLGKIETYLHVDGDSTIVYYSTIDANGRPGFGKNVLFQLHDGYIFAVGELHSVYTR